MKRYSVAEGTLEEILAELDRLGLDRTAQAKNGKATTVARAMADLESGAADEVRVEHTLYRVTRSDADAVQELPVPQG